MKLRDYLHKHKITQAGFGQLMRPPVSQGKVNHWLNGSRRVSLAEALHIHIVTAGEVAPTDLLSPCTPAPTPSAQGAEQGVSHA